MGINMHKTNPFIEFLQSCVFVLFLFFSLLVVAAGIYLAIANFGEGIFSMPILTSGILISCGITLFMVLINSQQT